MQIEKDKYYSLTQIANAKIVPGAKSYPTLHAEVYRDRLRAEKDRVLDALIMGEGRGTIIRIKGSNLLKYIEYKEAELAKPKEVKVYKQKKSQRGT